MSLKDCITSMLKKFGMKSCKADATATVSGQDLSLIDNKSKPCNITGYRSLIGKQLFAPNTVRNDISYIVGLFSRILQEPKDDHYKTARRVLRDLKSSKNLGIRYSDDKTNDEVLGYCDADWEKKFRQKISKWFGFQIWLWYY